MNSTIFEPPSQELMAYLRAMDKANILEIVPTERGHGIMLRTQRVANIVMQYPKILRIIKELTANEACTVELLATMKYWTSGCKTIILKQREIEAMERTNANFTMDDYKQPFPTMMLRLPKNYAINKIVDCPQGGIVFCGQVLPDEHQPIAVVLHHAKTEEINTLFSAVYFSSGQVITHHIDTLAGGETLQEILVQVKERQLTGDASFTPEESEVSLLCTKAAINTMLMLATEGFVERGPDAKMLEAQKRKAERLRRQGKINIANLIEHEIATHIWLYEFPPTFQFYTIARQHGTVSPHWRNGHMRMQRYGVANSLQKLIRIPPIYVNAHLLRMQ